MFWTSLQQEININLSNDVHEDILVRAAVSIATNALSIHKKGIEYKALSNISLKNDLPP